MSIAFPGYNGLHFIAAVAYLAALIAIAAQIEKDQPGIFGGQHYFLWHLSPETAGDRTA